MEDGQKRPRGLLVTRCHSAPFLQPVPHALDAFPVDVDPVWATHGSLIAAGWDGRCGTQIPHGRPVARDSPLRPRLRLTTAALEFPLLAFAMIASAIWCLSVSLSPDKNGGSSD